MYQKKKSFGIGEKISEYTVTQTAKNSSDTCPVQDGTINRRECDGKEGDINRCTCNNNDEVDKDYGYICLKDSYGIKKVFHTSELNKSIYCKSDKHTSFCSGKM